MTIEALDLRTLRRAALPKDALAAPAGVGEARPDVAVPVFALSKDAFAERLRAVALSEPCTRMVAAFPALDQMVFEQRTPVLGFPDTIRVQVVSLNAGVSAILYSRSRYGGWDLGVNRKRLRRWLARLKAG